MSADFLVRKKFTTHSGCETFFKIECDALTDEEIETGAMLIARLVGPFGNVFGVPTGGLRLAAALERHRWSNGPPLIVDDVLTTGFSMEEARVNLARGSAWRFVDIKGAVLFARGPCPDWIAPVFQMTLHGA